ncbi:uncharacterized protein F5891DRAFT_980307 [Suillus fuscotomentosus]|uniref:Uncharacterized protein n=1 Tax=Suillus fuscotomentosus TaxID=1912939 RepID=A0AAD4HLZ7_9AGAM|nr:uncharacterized protein F5891DRAFT_980307 [Suillus fuscotomentosus]KAG1900344.1 hypothetical protein F5891DRAFT_980307 [Suillus fuscotomentosus]
MMVQLRVELRTFFLTVTYAAGPGASSSVRRIATEVQTRLRKLGSNTQDPLYWNPGDGSPFSPASLVHESLWTYRHLSKNAATFGGVLLALLWWSAPIPSSTYNQFSIHAVKNMTTCAPGIITWTYNGSSPNILVSITNVNVLDPDPQRDLTRRQNTAKQISVTLTNTSAILDYWIWPQVDQPQGCNGSDTACLLSSSSLSPGPTSPVTVAETSSVTLSVGKIMGIVVGSLAGLIVLVLAIAYYLCRQCCSPTRGSKPKQSVGKRWSSLKSNDSAARSPAGGNGDSACSRGHSESMGEILIVADSGKEVSETITPQGSDEYHESRGEEKETYPHSPRGMIPVDTIHNPLSHYNRRISVHSLQDSYSFPDPYVCGDAGRTHTITSAHYSKQSFELQAARIRSSMESSAYMRTERFSLPAPAASTPHSPTSPSRGRDAYPPSPEAAISSRRPPSIGVVSVRRNSRKPVPHYDPSEFRDNLHSAVDNQSMITACESSYSHGTESLSPLHAMSGLSHNHIHYLIPDMPPRNE